ncbi:molybdenum cofactor cytidylyltransferase [Geosporobacter ferrireducens]|uniref:Molybdenum cofactor cytidylyltransferase n=1 Tax=Geosporobacter ferrireducens TaxID=1424294 RepID=A0A1D8GGC3_9FIRM|nr:molybdenum cofactor cytidylyltransferase [Geosporobacter ferrireducens]AOT69937.1 molybdenum cofactor cytidylyltransferase [Geosporobacter ferrireducens]MTI54367.1 molybdenum cofactor cytidylyltransferase [Geosporobacter ferrireducens]
MVTGIILAAGFSKRMGTEKLLLPVGGIPMIERVIQAVVDGGLEEIIFVYRRQEIKALADQYNLKTVYNKMAEEGQSTSVRAGLEAASQKSEGYLFFVGDQVFLTASVIHQLMTAFKQNPQAIVVPVYKEKRGNPVLFPQKLRRELMRIEGDQGGRMLIEKYRKSVIWVPIEIENAEMDVDTVEGYEAVFNREE